MQNIAWAKESDLTKILEINKSFFTSYSHDESFFKEGLSAERVVLAYFDGTIAGYLIFQVLWGNTPFLALLRVLPEYRGKGLGKELLAACLERVRRVGYKALISSSEKVNLEGNAFHRKMGFNEIGVVQMIYGEEVFYRIDL